MTTKPYRLPDPQKQPDSFLVILYKTLKSIPYDDRAWDKLYFARGMKRTGELLEVFKGNVQLAAECMKGLKERFEGDGLSWTIETVIQYSFEWRSQNTAVNDRDCLRSLVGAYKSQGVQMLAIEPPPLLAPPPECQHPDYKPVAGKEWVCPCGQKLYHPKPEEFQKIHAAITPKKVSEGVA
jgi:hypothetical protein